MDRRDVLKDDEAAETMSEAESLDSSTTSPPKKEKILTGRGVTLSMLMSDGVVEAGKDCLSIEYLGSKFTADLMTDGRIFWSKEKQIFNSPSAWAIHIKSILNPGKRSGCGWASVKYNGKKLDVVKSQWFRNMKIPYLDDDNGSNDNSSLLENGNQSPGRPGDSDVDEEVSEDNKPCPPMSKVTKNRKRKLGDENDNHRIDLQRMKLGSSPPNTKAIPYSSLGKKSANKDPHKLVRCLSFKEMGKLQPFTVSITTNCLLIVDFHCHLTTSEVIGYLAGKWDPETQHMTILQAFPCRCRLGEKQNGASVEMEIRQSMNSRGLQLVGWYHSHPCSPAHPSLSDIECQMNYQLKLKGDGMSYQPCLAFICAPYNTHKAIKDSQLKAVWVMPPEEEKASLYGMPMDMTFTRQQDIFLTQEVLAEMKYLVEYYKDSSDMVLLNETWFETDTFLDKMKGSLSKKFPKDRSDKRLLDFIDSILT
ncbi:MPN domain-containing protein-like [Lytechinus pictus]|uniref:MPN domain-containing protein-like n=1 Tax=Lytechinus pictus TaxID=7653 RepID=UPI0030BA2A77